ncbi:MAG: hypothetical protein AB2689_26580 [Candidatus Thiodiazotropha taylori]
MFITENQLDEWVRGNSRDAQGLIVELVWRLVAVSSPNPKERRFPLGDSIGQHGADGILEVELAFDPFVPEGRSFWEIGTGLKAGAKATSDYSDLVEAIPESVRRESTFVFVSPLSGRRDWEYTWKEDAQGEWIEQRLDKQEWMDIRVIDGTKLIDWIHQFPPVEIWLAQRMFDKSIQQLETVEQRWNLVCTIGEPPPLTPKLFLANREDACGKLHEVVAGASVQLKLETHFPDQVIDFVSAYVADLNSEEQADTVGRCLVVSNADAWNTISSQREKLILIADSALDLSGEIGTKLIQKARRNGHAVIFGGPAGGIPDPASVQLRVPRPHQVREALEHAGYSEERARTLAQKNGGHLGSLLRCLQNLSLMPEWADGTAASELAIAELLGSWSDKSDGDCSVVEGLSGNSYGEWMGKMREVLHLPGTPLIHRDGNWRFTARYEGWYALGSRLFDEDLIRLQKVATSVLTEKDPQFELPKDERFTSRIQGMTLTHSQLLRCGLAESLALLGSHPKALKSSTYGRAEETAALAVREILTDADWKCWATLSDHLPLLAEAAPSEFLNAIEATLLKKPCPIDLLFSEEGDGITGRSYMSGILWALETLAWDSDYLIRVVVCLGELASRDPGGRWSNRPINSLTTIFLPWLPQTCASVDKRTTALSTLLDEVPEVGWKLLVSLLPQSHSSSSGTRRPAWRETIPEDWSKGVTEREYLELVELYSDMAVTTARDDCKRLAELIDQLENLPLPAQDQLLHYLRSDAVIMMSENDKLIIWTSLVDVVTKHRKYSDAEWAMRSDQVDKIDSVAESMAPDAPVHRYQRLFSEREFDLHEEKGSYEEQRGKLELRRQQALKEIANDGITAVLAFAEVVESPWQVGVAYGAFAGAESDSIVLPNLLESDQKQLCQFSSGFVKGRFRIGGWEWVDSVDTKHWSKSQIGKFLSLLPFTTGTWERSERLLRADESMYWNKTSANPYEVDADLESVIDKLIQYQRPLAALRCIYKMLNDKQPLDTKKVIQALLAAHASTETVRSLDSYEIVEVIKVLQSEPIEMSDDLLQVEWAYLSLLNRNNDASPILLEQRLANDPAFFCDVIRVVFRSENEEHQPEEPSDEKKSYAKKAYHLLSKWRIPPGYQENGSYDGDALNWWLEAVKEKCAKTGHLGIAMTMIGHSLIHVPSDPDGLWIHRSAAAALNAKGAGDMRIGFRTELYNSRGAHWVDPTGAPERELASKYFTKAESIESAGYQRVAAILRELAESYEREAESIVDSDRFDG